jgi:hypothetical protein
MEQKMTKITACVVFLASVSAANILYETSAFAQSVDGNYTSNKGNQLKINGGRYTYYGTYGGPVVSQGSLSESLQGIQFNGYLNYICTRNGPRLVCNDGRRVWVRK